MQRKCSAYLFEHFGNVSILKITFCMQGFIHYYGNGALTSEGCKLISWDSYLF